MTSRWDSAGRGRTGRLAACGAVLLLATWALMAGRALGAVGHTYLSSVSEAALGARLAAPSSIAVSSVSDDVFVGDTITGNVDVYSGSGEYLTQFGGGLIEPIAIAVDRATGQVFVADSIQEAVLVYAPDGAGEYALQGTWTGAAVPGGAFGELAGVAVDNSASVSAGDVYVVEASASSSNAGAVDVFRPKDGSAAEGEFIGRLAGGKPEEPNGVAVSSSTGRVLVADSAKGAVLAYSAAGAFEERISGKSSPFGSFSGKQEERGNVAGIAVDPTSGDLYVAEAERHVVSQYSASGAWEGWITSAQGEAMLGEPRGVGLDSSGDVLVADSGLGLLDTYGPGSVVPDAETGKVAKSGLSRTTATLTGIVNGEGKSAEYRFQYGETSSLGSETQLQASGSGEAPVSGEVKGLEPEHTYYYRVLAANEDGVNVGLVREFTTPPAVEGLSTGAASSVTQAGATLTGQLTPGGVDAHYYFEWGPTSSLGNTTPLPPGSDAGSGTASVQAQTPIAGLSANTVYHYRLIGDNGFGSTRGQQRTFTTAGPPRITSEPPTSVTQETATIHATVDPDQVATSYRFEYGPTAAYGSEAPVGGEAIGAGATPVAVSASLSDLAVGRTYHYRVVATNEDGTTLGPDQTVTTTASAPVDATYASEVKPTEATLNAQINPLGHDTAYYFEYGTADCEADPGACTDSPLPPGEDVGAGGQDVPERVHLSGLTPSTTYHFRVLDSNGLGTTEGPQRTFTTQPQPGSFALPDNRAWEMVTPPDKGGAPAEALTREGGIILASEDGDRLTYVADGALGDEAQGNRSPEWQQIIATRTQSGWSSQDIATPYTKPEGVNPGNPPEYQFFDPTLSTAFVAPFGEEAPPLAPGVTQTTIYLRDDGSGTYLPLVTEANTAPGTEFGGKLHFASATPDLSHIVINSAVALTGAGSARGLYEWSGGQLKFISVLPHGIKPAEIAELGFFGSVVTNAISTDGSRVIWSSKEENTGRGRLYMRDTVKGETIRLDAAQGVAEPEQGSAQYQAASSDGSRVFFTDKQRLTPDATPETGAEAGKPDLYECEIVEVAGKITCDLKDLTVDHNEGEHAAVQNFIFGASEDATSVYLVAQGVLAGNANGNGETAQPGQDNLYELHYDGSQWSTSFIATLSSEDGPEWEGHRNADTAYSTTRVSPNGQYLAFMSSAPITGYDNVDSNPAAHGARDEEVYLYDSADASLRCVSCNPSGARPAGVLDTKSSGEGLGLLVDRRQIWSEPGHERWLAGNIPGWTADSLTNAIFQSRYLSDQGRLYFNSPDSLVPAATNGKEDVYEYEPSGVGSCQSTTGGCVSLISGGSSERESAFIEATPEGSNVFFLTEATLVPQDTDTAFDIYDARECSEASPCLSPPEVQAPECGETQTCRPAQPAQPLGGAGGTSVFSGPGDAVTQPSSPTPKGETLAKKIAKPRTRAQKLAAALKQCRRRYSHSRRKRAVCERQARKRYGVVRRAKATKKRRASAKPSSGGKR